MRTMTCSTCKKQITWVPVPGGRRVVISAQQEPDGNWYIDNTGFLQPYHSKVGDVPRYARHVPCPEEA